MSEARHALLEPYIFAAVQVFAERGANPPQDFAELERLVAEKLARARAAQTGKPVVAGDLSEQDKILLRRALWDLVRGAWPPSIGAIPPSVEPAATSIGPAGAGQGAPRARRPVAGVLFALHGIRSHWGWSRVLGEIAWDTCWQVRLSRWSYGFFYALQFLRRKSRESKVDWFNETYEDECGDRDVRLGPGEHPSIVAHSFGTYILGYAMLKYPWLKFNKVLLCGSILPVEFDWKTIFDRNQVQEVRNEYSKRDFWAQIVGDYVEKTGPSGHRGFEFEHERFGQQEFEYRHCGYFNKGHIKNNWMPFLNGPADPWEQSEGRSGECEMPAKSPRPSKHVSVVQAPAGITELRLAIELPSGVVERKAEARSADSGASKKAESKPAENPGKSPLGSVVAVAILAAAAYFVWHIGPFFPDLATVADRPTRQQVEAAPPVPAKEVELWYRDETGEISDLLVYDWSWHYRMASEGPALVVPVQGAAAGGAAEGQPAARFADLRRPSSPGPVNSVWKSLSMSKDGSYRAFRDFGEATGWYSFFVWSEKERKFLTLGTKNVFYARRPMLTVKATGDKERPYALEFGAGQPMTSVRE